MTTKAATTTVIAKTSDRVQFPNELLLIGSFERIHFCEKIAFLTVFNGIYETVKVFSQALPFDQLKAALKDTAKGDYIAVGYTRRYEDVRPDDMSAKQKASAKAGHKVTVNFNRADWISTDVTVDDNGWKVNGKQVKGFTL